MSEAVLKRWLPPVMLALATAYFTINLFPHRVSADRLNRTSYVADKPRSLARQWFKSEVPGPAGVLRGHDAAGRTFRRRLPLLGGNRDAAGREVIVLPWSSSRILGPKGAADLTATWQDEPLALHSDQRAGTWWLEGRTVCIALVTRDFASTLAWLVRERVRDEEDLIFVQRGLFSAPVETGGLRPGEGPHPQFGLPRVRWGLMPGTRLRLRALRPFTLRVTLILTSDLPGQILGLEVNGSLLREIPLKPTRQFTSVAFQCKMQTGENTVRIGYALRHPFEATDPRPRTVLYSRIVLEEAP